MEDKKVKVINDEKLEDVAGGDDGMVTTSIREQFERCCKERGLNPYQTMHKLNYLSKKKGTSLEQEVEAFINGN